MGKLDGPDITPVEAPKGVNSDKKIPEFKKPETVTDKYKNLSNEQLATLYTNSLPPEVNNRSDEEEFNYNEALNNLNTGGEFAREEIISKIESSLKYKNSNKNQDNNLDGNNSDFNEMYSALNEKQKLTLIGLARQLTSDSHESENDESLNRSMYEILTSKNPSNAALRFRNILKNS